LSKREILQLIKTRKPSKEIYQDLFVVETILNTDKKMIRKLGLTSNNRFEYKIDKKYQF
jgi:DNA-binding CsgD family transcriptional regulator